jgi:hypothetical protein
MGVVALGITDTVLPLQVCNDVVTMQSQIFRLQSNKEGKIGPGVAVLAAVKSLMRLGAHINNIQPLLFI